MPNSSRNPGFADVVGDATLETLASGLGFTEGPVWHPYEKWLVFSDMPENRMYMRQPSGVIEDFRRPIPSPSPEPDYRGAASAGRRMGR